MVKNFSFFIIFLFLQISSLFCTFEHLKILPQVKELMAQEKYQEVLSMLLSIKHKNSAICMLVAQCYEKLGKKTVARAYLKKAYVYGNYKQKVGALDTLMALEGSIKQNSQEKLLQKILCILDFLPMLLLQLFVLLFLFLLLYVISNHHLRMFLMLPSIIILFGTIIIKHNLNTPYAITLKETTLYSAPEEQAPIIGIVAENNTVYYTEGNNVFYKIETHDKKRGWIHKDALMRIV